MLDWTWIDNHLCLHPLTVPSHVHKKNWVDRANAEVRQLWKTKCLQFPFQQNKVEILFTQTFVFTIHHATELKCSRRFVCQRWCSNKQY